MKITNEVYEVISQQFLREGTTEEVLFEGLGEESGEVLAERLKEISKNQDRSYKIKDELSDVLWYITSIAINRGFSLSDLMTHSILKLEDRSLNGKKHKKKGYLTLKNKQGETNDSSHN